MAKPAESVAEVAFAALLGPTWAVLLVSLALVERREYQIDLYAESGPWVWSAILVNLAASVAAVHLAPRLRRLAFVNLGALMLTTLAVPYLMGYYSYGRSDALTLIGSIGGTMRRGHVQPYNLYPGTDFVAATLGFGTGLPPHVLFWVLALVGSLVLMLSLYLLIREAAPRPAPAYAFLPAFVLYCAWIQATGIPNFNYFAVATVAVLCAVALPQRGAGRLACMMLLCAAVALGHPFVTAFLLAAFVALALLGKRGTRLDVLLAVTFLGLAFTLWAFTNTGLVTAVQNSLRLFSLSHEDPVSGEAVDKIDRAALSIGEWAALAILYLSRYIVPVFLVAIGVVAVRWRDWLAAQPRWAWVLLATGTVVQALLFFNPIVIENAVRVVNLNYAILGLVPLAGVALVLLGRLGRAGTAIGAVLCFTMIGGTVLGTFDSPAIERPNAEFGREEVVAARWMVGERGPYSIYNPRGVFEQRAMGLLNDTANRDNPLRPAHEGILPDHFASWPREGRVPFYVAVPRLDEIVYPELYPHIDRFNGDDYAALEQDPTLSRVYDSLGLRTYFYHPPAAT